LDYGTLMDDAQFRFVLETYSSSELTDREKAVLGLAIAHDPIMPYQSLIKERGLSSLSMIRSATTQLVLVRVVEVKPITTKTQNPWPLSRLRMVQ
jgi:hypothetical protein